MWAKFRLHTKLCSAAAAALASLPCAVLAADNGFYFGAAVGDAYVDDDWVGDALAQHDRWTTDEGNGFKLIGGIRPIDALAVELDYVDFGAQSLAIGVVCPAVVGYPCPDRGEIDTRAVSLSAIGFLTLPLVDLFARVGLSRWESEREIRFSPATEESDTDLTYGVGAQLRVGSFALRLEYERLDWSGGNSDLASVGFTYTFL